MAAKIHTIKCKNRLTIYLHLLEIIIRGILTLTAGQNSDQFTSMSEKPASRGTISHQSETEEEARWTQCGARCGENRAPVIGGEQQGRLPIGRLGGRASASKFGYLITPVPETINMDPPLVTSLFSLFTYCLFRYKICFKTIGGHNGFTVQHGRTTRSYNLF